MHILCPKCHEKLVKVERSYKCVNKHSYDIAKSGYVNLFITNTKNHGDNKEMIKARTNFLQSGAYAFLKDYLVNICHTYKPTNLLDLACGEGYYTKDFIAKEKIGIDLSKDALNYASKHDSSTFYILSSIFDTPINSNSIDMIVTCFAPLAKDEINRLLKDDGIFVYVTPGPRHLIEMKEVLYTHPYLNEIKDIDDFIDCIEDNTISLPFHPTNIDLQNLFMMTPYAYKTGVGGLEKLQKTNNLTVTAEFHIRIYKKNRDF